MKEIAPAISKILAGKVLLKFIRYLAVGYMDLNLFLYTLQKIAET